jgi:CrcB protein
MNINVTEFLLICGAGGVGAMARAVCAATLTRFLHPAGAVFVINGAGSFLIGVMLGVLLVSLAPFNAASVPMSFSVLAIGVLGGFTTVSTFALQVQLLWQEGQARAAVLTALGSVLLCPASAFLGVMIVSVIFEGA